MSHQAASPRQNEGQCHRAPIIYLVIQRRVRC